MSRRGRLSQITSHQDGGMERCGRQDCKHTSINNGNGYPIDRWKRWKRFFLCDNGLAWLKLKSTQEKTVNSEALYIGLMIKAQI